jgi:hypothetical protein
MNTETNIKTKNLFSSGQFNSQVRGQEQLTTQLTTPACEEREMIQFCSSLDLKTAQDPAPPTMCERGLGPISGKIIKISDSSKSSRGRVDPELKVILQKRDREIMRVCYEQQFLLSDQIQRFFYNGKNQCNGFVRVKELERFGLVRRLVQPTLDGKNLIRLTPKGLRTIAEDLVIEVPQVNKPDIRTLRHDVIVTSVRLRLQELWTGSWIPERVIKQEDFPRIPDGLFIFPSGKKVAVEVENTPKSRARFLSILEDWRKVDVKLVLYVATAPYLFNIIQRLLPDGPRGVPFALVLWDDLKNGATRVSSVAGMVDIFSRKEY